MFFGLFKTKKKKVNRKKQTSDKSIKKKVTNKKIVKKPYKNFRIHHVRPISPYVR